MTVLDPSGDQPTHQQVRPRPRRTALLVAAGVLSIAVLVDKIAYRLPMFLTVISGQMIPPEADHVSAGTVTRYAWWILAALLALLCLVLVDGRHRAGLGQSAARNTWVLGHYLTSLTFFQFLAVAAMGLLLTRFPGLNHWIGNDGLNDPTAWFLVYESAMAGVVEEIIVIAVAFRLLEQVPTRAGTRPFINTGWATAVLIALRLSYHCYYGLVMIIIATFAWLSVRMYRHNRTLLPLIIGHTLLDIAILMSNGLLVLVITGFILIFLSGGRGGTPRSLLAPFGLPSSHSRQDNCGPTRFR